MLHSDESKSVEGEAEAPVAQESRTLLVITAETAPSVAGSLWDSEKLRGITTQLKTSRESQGFAMNCVNLGRNPLWNVPVQFVETLG
jgi:hypothetical protein